MKQYILSSISFLLTSLAVLLGLVMLQPAAVFAQQQLNVTQGSASLNWSGYLAQSQNTSVQNNYTNITGTWVVPSVSANTSGTADATWVGIGGVTSHDLIQAGTQAIVQNGTVTYNAWVETLPGYAQTISLGVTSGDSITTTLTQESAGVWRITIVNNTTGQSYSATRTYASSLSSAEWVEEMVSNTDGTFRPLDDFGTVSFINASATVNGTNENLSQLGATPLQMVNGQGGVLAQASALNGDSAGFTVSRTSATPSTTTPRTITGGRWRVVNTATSTSAQPVPMTVTIIRRGGHRVSFSPTTSYSINGNTITIGGFTFSIVRL